MIRLSIIVPCYNDENNLIELQKRLFKLLNSNVDNYEIIYIDDGSKDNTWEVIKIISINYPNVKGIRFSRNFGHQNAITAGLDVAQGERIVIIDSDLEDPPELILEMMRFMDEGADHVYGVRRSRKGISLFKKSCYKLFYKILTFLSGTKIPENAGDFRMFNSKVLNELRKMREYHRFLRGMVCWLGFKQVPLFYDRQTRFSGQSGYTLSKLLRIAIDGITSFSIKPLRLASILGCIFGFLCIIGLVWAIYGYVSGKTSVAGWTSIVSIILLGFSLQFFVLGIFGEYLGRLFIEQKNRPLYVISEKTNFN